MVILTLQCQMVEDAINNIAWNSVTLLFTGCQVFKKIAAPFYKMCA